MRIPLIGAFLALTFVSPDFAEDSAKQPRPIPLTRPEMKRLLEDMKDRKPRIPLPELTADEKEKLGERGNNYEGRLRSVYMPGIASGFGGFRPAGQGERGGNANPPAGNAPGAADRTRGPNAPQEEGMTLSYAFKTELFWIVSRTNNCQYCMGHQESKLLGAGLTEDQIAALDSDWSRFTPAEQAAFAYARKFTFQPYLLNDADITSLRKHYTDLQIMEMSLSMAGNNAINRWKEGVGVPQGRNGGGFRGAAGEAEQNHSYLTPTSAEFLNVITKVAPATIGKDGKPSSATSAVRPPLESREEVERALAAAASRTPRLPLVDDAKAREALGENWTDKGPLPQWVRLLANFPRDGGNRIRSFKSAEDQGDLKPLLKAQVTWIVARQDRAWYMTGLAKKWLNSLGQTDDQIYRLDGTWKEFTPAEQALFTVARNLATSPVVLTDEEVDRAVELAGPRDVVQLVNFVTTRAALDRLTEAAGLNGG